MEKEKKKKKKRRRKRKRKRIFRYSTLAKHAEAI